MFGFIKKALTSIYHHVTSRLASIFSRTTVDETTLQELQQILLESDAGVQTSIAIMNELRKTLARNPHLTGSELREALKSQLESRLSSSIFNENADVYLLVGINGSGKTTLCSKLAYRFKRQNKRVLLVAADTFRAAAQEQLAEWGKRLNVPVITAGDQKDPAAVVFAGCQEFKKGSYDVVIIDTAGRLQTKINLMKELEKLKKVISKQLPDAAITTILTVDAMLGQSSFDQALVFHESTTVNGIALTKMDGTGKGGIVFAIEQNLRIPIAYVSSGEQPEQLALFNAHEYIHDLLYK